ncbi:hypothetical protein ACOMHN_040834 [Nucella lapillus]
MFVFALLAVLCVATAGGQQRVGGIVDTRVSPGHEAVVFAVQAINDQFSSGSASPPLQLVEVVRARSQVVSGQLLYLTLLVRGNQDFFCDVIVWSRPWLANPDRLRIREAPSCRRSQIADNNSGQNQAGIYGQPGYAARQPIGSGLPGGISDARPVPGQSQYDPEGIRDALAFAACAANDRVNTAFAITVAHEIIGATFTKQVTSGLTYRFYSVPMSATTCRNVGCARLNLSSCLPAPGAQLRRCNFQVQLPASRRPQYQLINVDC